MVSLLLKELVSWLDTKGKSSHWYHTGVVFMSMKDDSKRGLFDSR